MFEILCGDDLYTYNMYHLAKAFFPGEHIVQIVDKNGAAAVSVMLPNGQGIIIDKKEVENFDERTERKHYVDTKVYRFFEKITGKSLAWGILTGVRPTKIAMAKLKCGAEKESFAEWFLENSLVSEDKGRLAMDIALRETEILRPLDYMKGYSLYVGIPFCPSVCSYCSFSSGSLAEWGHELEHYLNALLKELTFIGSVSKEKKLNTIYIGGGTPTVLSPSQLQRLLKHIDRTFSKESLLEYTVEAGRPDSITEEKLKLLKDFGVTRISINPQTMQQKTLDLIGRNHTVKETADAYFMARETGFDNINMDLIAGLPKETVTDMEDTLKKIKILAPDSLTVHALAIKRAAKLGREKSETERISDTNGDSFLVADTLSKMIDLAAQTADEMGLQPYYLYRQKNIAGNFENVGYAKVDKAGIYNILIMEEVQTIVAAGAGASTKILLKEPVIVPGSRNNKKTTLIRVENVKNIREYITRIDEMIERKGEWLWH